MKAYEHCSLSAGVRHQSSSSPEEADRKHGQGVHSREAERTAGLSGLYYPAPTALQRSACQEVPGPKQLFFQLYRFVSSSSPTDYFQLVSFRGGNSNTVCAAERRLKMKFTEEAKS